MLLYFLIFTLVLIIVLVIREEILYQILLHQKQIMEAEPTLENSGI